MNRMLALIIAVIVVLVASSSFAATKKKPAKTAKTKTSETKSAETKTGETKSDPKKDAAPGNGWTRVATEGPELCSASYRHDNGSITLKLKNLSSDKRTRATYSVQCKVQTKGGKWESFATYPSDGIKITLRKQDEIDRVIRTGGVSVKDVVVKVAVAASE